MKQHKQSTKDLIKLTESRWKTNETLDRVRDSSKFVVDLISKIKTK